MKKQQIDYRGSKNGKAKLTEDKVLEIRALFNNGNYYRQQDVADDYGVSVATINKVKTGKAWTHV